MIRNKQFKGFVIFVSAAVLSLSTIQSAFARPGPLATAPLFLTSAVEPNMYFSFDDSGSMRNDTLYENDTAGIPSFTGNPLIHIGNDPLTEVGSIVRQFTFYDKEYIPPALEDLNEEWEKHWPIFNHEANKLYYNPNFEYKPWPGLNEDGTPMYTDADPTAVEERPWQPGYNRVNITVFHTYTENFNGESFSTDRHWYPTYFTWTDTNADPTLDGNGEMDVTDTHTRVEIPVGTTEMQNFANYLQYWRSRMHAAKAVLGNIINQVTGIRLGMNFFNDGRTFDVATMGDLDQKRQLLELLYPQDANGGTPTRLTVRRVGQYFSQRGGGAPILPAAQGGECQQNFSVVLTDGFWKGGNPGWGNNDINSANPYDGDASQSNDGGNYADGFSNTLADGTMLFYKTDLRPDLDDNVPTKEDIDEAPHQHLVTYTIAFGIRGTLDPTSVDPTDPGFAWPEPVAETETTVDDLWHAAYNSRGEFLLASDPGQLVRSLQDAVQDITERSAVASAVSINSANLSTDSTVFVARFDSGSWTGNLLAFKIADLETGELAVTPDWNAAQVLDGRNLDNQPRTILTYDGSDGIPFQWDDLAAAQKADLKTSPSGGVDSDAIGEARLDFIRGDTSNEGVGLGFRERVGRLGDLVNSGPVYVAEPSLNWPDFEPFPSLEGQRYSDYQNGPAAGRDPVVYVGANDGMLHGFRESDGVEVLAYVPNSVYSTGRNAGLHYLTDPQYKHIYYNDLTPTISDIYAALGGATKWHTVLISGQRGGARGVYALNVTDPDTFSEDNASSLVLWEFTNADDPDLGYTYSRPQIARTNTNRWVAIFGNGYNDTGDDGHAKLFILDIEKGADGSWVKGENYWVLDTETGDDIDRNGLSSPTLVDLNGDGNVDRVYAGDLHGYMHWFDLSDPNGIWSTGRLARTVDAGPITAAPAIARHPTIADDPSLAPNVMVYFGSGQFLTNGDKTTTADHHYHGVWDKGDDLGDETGTAGSLVEQTYDTNFPQRVLTNNSVDYVGGDYGWYFDLPASGERSITSGVVRGNLVFFNSFVPLDRPCSGGGFGFRFAVRLDTGGSSDDAAFDSNDDGVVDENDSVSDAAGNTANMAAIRQEGYLPAPVFIEDITYTADQPAKVIKLREIPKGRFSWMEIIQ